jgi:hypothetical protein
MRARLLTGNAPMCHRVKNASEAAVGIAQEALQL